MTYPIRIPNELVDHWRDLYQSEGHMPEWILRYVAKQAAQWGADQELEACCEWLDAGLRTPYVAIRLRSDRRSKPPSLKEQALEQLDQISTCFRISHGGPIVCDKIRRALEALPND